MATSAAEILNSEKMPGSRDVGSVPLITIEDSENNMPDPEEIEIDNQRHHSQVRENLSSEDIVTNENDLGPSDQGPRRSMRPRVLSEKARQNRESELATSFWTKYRDCESFVSDADNKCKGHLDSFARESLISKLDSADLEINEIYSELRIVSHDCPPSEIRRGIDIITAKIQDASSRIQITRSENGSFGKGSRRSSISYRSSRRSEYSSKRLEAISKAAALQVELEAQMDEAKQEEELRVLKLKEAKMRVHREAEEKARQASLEAEEKARQAEAEAEMSRRRQEIERQKISKLLRIEQAKIRALDDEEQLSEHGSNQVRFKPLIRDRDGTPIVNGIVSTETALSVSLKDSKDAQPMETNNKGNITEMDERQVDTCKLSSDSKSPHTLNPLVPTWHPPATKNDIGLIAEALAASVSLSRLPVPEPPIFMGDALSYPDWRAAFAVLIESRGIPPQERIHYLRRYVGGTAREMISGYFLLKSQNAFDRAMEKLEDRYGDPFTIGDAFRNKLESWPKIGPKDSKGLRRFADLLAQCDVAMNDIKGLEVLNDCRENKKLLQKLPDWIVTRWARIVNRSKTESHEYPTFAEFVKFITDEATIACDPITSLEALRNSTEKEKTHDHKRNGPGRAHILVTESKSEGRTWQNKGCEFCLKENHSICDCRALASKPLTERHNYVKTNGLCYGCLKQGHHSKLCPQRSVCKKCQGKHPTSLHEEKRKPDQSNWKGSKKPFEKSKNIRGETNVERIPRDRPNPEIKSARCEEVTSKNSEGMSSMVVPVWVSSVDHPDREVLVYALLDTQSDTTFILKETGDMLETHKEPVNLRLTTMTSRDRIISCEKFQNLFVRGFTSNIKIKLPVTYSREYIPVEDSHIPTPETAGKWPHLADVSHHLQPHLNCAVGLLIGYNCPQALAPRKCITGNGNQPFAVETDLGWSIVGPGDHVEDSGDSIGVTHRVITRQVPENVQLPDGQKEVKYSCRTIIKEETIRPADIVRIMESDFTEASGKDTLLSQEDIHFMKIVEEGVYKEKNHYVMPLPFKESRPQLPDNKFMARRRLESLKRRFIHDPKYFADYNKFMKDILERGDAERVQDESSLNGPSWYIPHHGVYHPKKPDKIRVVFDCSAKCKGTSLNDHLLQGPDLINSLIGVLCRFRQEPVAVVCDIEKMFHQFWVHPSDRDYLRFLWWDTDNLSSEPVAYRMKVHLFGAVSSPGCANYGLKRVAKDNPQFGPEAVNFITNDFYVDDGLTSVDTEDNAVNLIQNTRSACDSGGLRLHKFASNSRTVMESIPVSERAANIKELDLSLEELPIERALGIQWCIESDEFRFRLVLKDQPLTRRGILSTVSSVFDPLGLIAPFILKGKQILQQICQEGIDWDDPIPETSRVIWEKWRSELPDLADIKIRRCFKPAGFGNVKEVELHHFSDASLQGYGQCSYVRLIDDKLKVHCSLAMAKARVVPLKPTTIPRLELQAAVVSVQVSKVLAKELKYESMKHYFWTDSKVVLGYINNEARRFHIFVANRVQRIKDGSSPEQWAYVNTLENPADHASRGLGAKELMASNWFKGPEFLWKGDTLMEREFNNKNELCPNDPEVKHVLALTTKSLEEEKPDIIDRLTRFSSWSRAVRALTVLRRCIFRHGGKPVGTIVEEKVRTEQVVIKALQNKVFHEDIDSLSRNGPVKSPGLQKLDPFVEEKGMLRVGGRLRQSSLPYRIKHPLILPRRNHVVNLIITHFHESIAHQGRGMTINEVRSNGFWILGCSAAVSSIIYKCVPCRRLRSKAQGQKMANLPDERLESSPPFTYCGMDCFGPFYIREGRKELKRYGLLFTCFASRAVHIETIDDMSTDCFMNGLRCLIALRGHVRLIRCDQGSNFIGAKHELQLALKEMDQEKIKEALACCNCDFEMNPPSASHMGGVWERQIRTIRSVLSGLLDQNGHQLNVSSLRTLMYEAMAIINSRPLSVENLNEPGGPLPLTPNHLLTMKSGVVLPPPGNFPREDLYLKKRWRRVQHLANQFWSRWRKEYLHNLQLRQKWHQQKRNIQVGDVVILKDESLARSCWKLARVKETTKDTDGLVRRVKLLIGDSSLNKAGKRTAKPQILERPIHKLVLLVESQE